MQSLEPKLRPLAHPAQSFIVQKYLKIYEQNPRSRVFAPLAEALRKAGFPDLAIETAKDGLIHHPNFMAGKIALARAYLDSKAYHEVIALLEPVVQEIPDHFLAQRLLADSYLLTGNEPKALEAYKILLFFAPTDTQLAAIVQEMENRLFNHADYLLSTRDSPDSPTSDKTRINDKVQTLANLLAQTERNYRKRVISGP